MNYIKEASSFSLYQNQEETEIQISSDSSVEANFIKKTSIKTEEKIPSECTYINIYPDLEKKHQ